MLNCMIVGVGGQGTVLASKLLAQTALHQGFQVRTAETIGMAQRGGCVVSHVRIGEGVFSPLIGLSTADLIIGFEPAEAVRCLHYLKKQGTVLVNTRAVRPITASLSNSGYNGSEMLDYLRRQNIRLIELDGDDLISICGSARALNVALLGAAAASNVLPFTVEQLETAIRTFLPEKFIDLNLKALQAGNDAVRKGNLP